MRRLAMLLGAALCAAPPSALANDWWGTTSMDWNTAANWESGVPTGAQDVRISWPSALPPSNSPGIFSGVDALAFRLFLGTTDGHVASLTIGSNGTLTVADEAYIGEGTAGGAGSLAGMIVGGTDARFTAARLFVGVHGYGTLNIAGGGQAVVSGPQSSHIGLNEGSTGAVTVTGADSLLRIEQGHLYVGDDGIGMLTVFDGAEARALANLYVGNGPTGRGEVTVDGNNTNTGSQLHVVGNLIVGHDGTGGLLVDHGGRVYAMYGGLTHIGWGAGSYGYASIGNGSQLHATDLFVADSGDGELLVSGGSQVSAASISIAHQGGTGSILVTGAGSSLDVTHSLTLGNDGWGQLTVADGGTITVDGPLRIGEAGAGGRLDIGGAPGIAPGTVNASSVVLGAGGTGMLIIYHSDTSGGYTFAPGISGNGSIVLGSGTTVFSGNSSAFAGNTALAAGSTLVVNGSLGGALGLMGTLKGTGTLGIVQAFSGGIIAPGNSIGTLNVGTLTFDAGSVYEVEVNDDGTTPGIHNDWIHASGTATLSSTASVHVMPENGTDTGATYAPDNTYTILTADGGVTGTFGAVTDSFAFLNSALSYDANNVYLTLTRNDLGFASVGLTPNQIATAGGADSLGGGNAVYDAVVGLSEAQALAAFDALSGELHASARTALIEDSRFPREAALDRIRLASGAMGVPDGVRSDTAAVWGRVVGARGEWDGDRNAAPLERTLGGFYLGGDGRLTEHLRAGLMGGYSRARLEANARHSAATVDTYTVGAYGGGQWDAVALRVGGAYSWHALETRRNVHFGSFSQRATGDYRARTGQVYGEAAYQMEAGPARFEPYANVAHVRLSGGRYTEKGGAAALRSRGGDADAAFATVGLRAETPLAIRDAQATLRGMAGWRRAFGDRTPDARQSFAAGGSEFTIAGTPVAREAFVLDVGFDLRFTPRATLGLGYAGQFRSGRADQGVQANLAVAF